MGNTSSGEESSTSRTKVKPNNQRVAQSPVASVAQLPVASVAQPSNDKTGQRRYLAKIISTAAQKSDRDHFYLEDIYNLLAETTGKPFNDIDELKIIIRDYCGPLEIRQDPDGKEVYIPINKKKNPKPQNAEMKKKAAPPQPAPVAALPVLPPGYVLVAPVVGLPPATAPQHPKHQNAQKSNPKNASKPNQQGPAGNQQRGKNQQNQQKGANNQPQKPHQPNTPTKARNQGGSGKITEVPPYYQALLRNAMGSFNVTGTTVPEFKARFLLETKEELSTFGREEFEFFSLFPEIFRVERQGQVLRLFPKPKTGLMRQKAAGKSVSNNDFSNNPGNVQRNQFASVSNFMKDLNISGGSNFPNSSSGGMKPVYDTTCSLQFLSQGRKIWIVKIGRFNYVPTGSIAALINKMNDTIHDELSHKGFLPAHTKRLTDESVIGVLMTNGVSRDRNITILPTRSIADVLRILQPGRADESLINEINDLTRKLNMQ